MMVSVTHEEREALIAQIRATNPYGEESRTDLLAMALEAADALVSVQAERDAYAAKLSAIHEKLSTPLGLAVPRGRQREGRALWQAVLAGQVRVILAQVNAADLLAARDAEKWDEGAVAAFNDSAHGCEDEFWDTNPYRKAGEK